MKECYRRTCWVSQFLLYNLVLSNYLTHLAQVLWVFFHMSGIMDQILYTTTPTLPHHQLHVLKS